MSIIDVLVNLKDNPESSFINEDNEIIRLVGMSVIVCEGSYCSEISTELILTDERSYERLL